MAASCWLITSKALALSNEERIQLLDNKFIKGEMSEEEYKRLLKKYTGVKGSTNEVKVAPEKVQPVAGNIVENWSFEHSKNEMPVDWKLSMSPANCKIDNTTAHSGNSSLKIFCSSIVWGKGILQETPFFPGKSYLVSFWYKGKNVVPKDREGSVLMALEYYDTQAKKYKPIYICPLPKLKQVPTDWKRAMKKITIPSHAEAGKGNIEFRLYKGTGVLWYDDVVVKPMP